MPMMGSTPPNTANQLFTFKGDKETVLKWCMCNLMDDLDRMSSSNQSVIDAQGYWRWRMAGNRILFERAEDAAIFQLAWGEFE